MAVGGPGSRPSVLIVDDDREIREVLGEMLADEGFIDRGRLERRRGHGRLQAGFRPDVIILDLMMPVMDGMTFRAELKQNPELAAIPVIGVTAAADLRDRLRVPAQAGQARHAHQPNTDALH